MIALYIAFRPGQGKIKSTVSLSVWKAKVLLANQTVADEYYI